MKVRAYEPRDAQALSRVYRAAVEAIGPVHYTTEQVFAWASLTPDADKLHARLSDGRVAIVLADDADQPVAFGDLEKDGHIDLLYCAPEAARSGLMGVLYATLEAIAREQGLSRLYSEASEAAVRFFGRQGFATVGRRDLQIGGVAIHNYAVEKPLI